MMKIIDITVSEVDRSKLEYKLLKLINMKSLMNIKKLTDIGKLIKFELPFEDPFKVWIELTMQTNHNNFND
jgi:hypothetical protein